MQIALGWITQIIHHHRHRQLARLAKLPNGDHVPALVHAEHLDIFLDVIEIGARASRRAESPPSACSPHREADRRPANAAGAAVHVVLVIFRDRFERTKHFFRASFAPSPYSQPPPPGHTARSLNSARNHRHRDEALRQPSAESSVPRSPQPAPVQHPEPSQPLAQAHAPSALVAVEASPPGPGAGASAGAGGVGRRRFRLAQRAAGVSVGAAGVARAFPSDPPPRILPRERVPEGAREGGRLVPSANFPPKWTASNRTQESRSNACGAVAT